MRFKLSRTAGALGLATLVAATACYAATTTVIDQVRQRFSLSTLSILSGDKVQFINHDDVRHNIHLYGSDDSDVDRGLQDPGQTIDVTFDRYGLFTVRCSIHQKMKMRIEVR